MKLLTINTHSLIEEDSDKKAKMLADAISQELPDIVAMQEVNQTSSEEITDNSLFTTNDIIRSDNYALRVMDLLKDRGKEYFASWMAIKNGYNKFDEGMAILSRSKIEDVKELLISEKNDYNDWKTRKILGIKTRGEWFFSVHMGWWNDKDPFNAQWERLTSQLPKGKVWLMGDFNNSADVADEGYDLIKKGGWLDTYILAQEKDNGYTVESEIDGWKKSGITKVRIDYIFCNYKLNVCSSKVIFNSKNRPRISDHYGVIIETEGLD